MRYSCRLPTQSNDDETNERSSRCGVLFFFPVPFSFCFFPFVFFWYSLGLSLEYECRIGYRSDSLFFPFRRFFFPSFLFLFFGCFLSPFDPHFPTIRI